MSLFASTTFYNIQPVAIAGAVYSIRTDPSASFVQLAVPGTNFGSVFGQSNFQNDISATVRGTGTNVNLIVTSSSATSCCIISSSLVSSGSFNFAASDIAYSTSVFQEDAGSMGAVPGATFSNFTSTDWAVECWVYMQERLYPGGGAPFHKSILRNTDSTFSLDMTFVAPNSPLFRMRLIRGANQYFSGNIASNLNAWYHMAWGFTSSTNTINFYWSGNRITTTASTVGAITSGINYRVLGGDMGVNDGAKGSVQDYRVTIGSNRGYTGTTITIPNSIVIFQ